MSIMLPDPGPILGAQDDVLPYTPLREDDDVRRCIAVALRELDKRKPKVDKRWQYHEGQQAALWMTPKVREVFGTGFADTKLDDNYCELAVETVVLRLGVKGWTLRRQPPADATPEQRATLMQAVQAVNVQWDANRLDLEQEELYRAARVAGEAYLHCWPRYVNDPEDPDSAEQATDDDGVPLYDITLQDARNVYLHMGTSGRDRRYAVKVWKDDAARRWRATVTFPEEVVRFRTVEGSTGSKPPKADRFQLDEDDPGGENPMGVVPFYRFARDRKGRSALDSLMPPQDKINKLSVGKMVAAEFAAMRQRYALLGEEVPDNVLKAVPGSVWKLPAGGPTEDDPSNPKTVVGEFSAADLSVFDNAKDAEVQTLLTLGMLPRNLRVKDGAGSSASGEAITKDSGPFVSMVEDHQAMYGGSWRDLWEDLGYDVVPAWAPAAFSDPGQVATEVKTYTDAGVPLELALKWTGRTEEDLADVKRLLDEQETRRANASAAALQAFDQGESPLDVLRRNAGTEA